MADSVSFNFDELNTLAADLGEIPRSARKNVRAALQVTARNVKDAWRGKLEGSETLPALPYAVTYDVDANKVFGVDVLRAEIGFDKSRSQGPLGNISEFGTPSTPPRGFGHAALEENQADFERGISIALDETLKEAGL